MIDTTQSSATQSQEADLTDLRDKVLQDLQTRDEWLRRQAVWYAMRHDGLRRRNKPWPNAADLHFPLADSIIERLKPFYFNQLFATETLASFISTKAELTALTSDAGYWFDHKLKQESNLETEILVAIDQMLMAGLGIVKVYWEPGRNLSAGQATPPPPSASSKDPDFGGIESEQPPVTAPTPPIDSPEPSASANPAQPARLAFDALDPSRVIVPQWTKALQEADRVTLVQTLSVEQYKRDPRFTRKDDDFLKSIAGKGRSQDGTNESEAQLKLRREGLTYSPSDDEIVYWEVWEQTEEGWVVHWLSPMQPEPLRPSMRNPFRHGRLPLVRLEVEVKDKGHYSSRGIPERVGAFEASANKLWNEKTDYMTLCNRPLFTTPAPIPNAGNLRLVPGQIIAGGLSAVQMPAPPVSFEQEMQAQRSVAEQLIGMPDFGQGNDQNTESPRTATEVQHISSLMNVSVDLRARTFRKSLGDLYSLAWETLLQYDTGTQYLMGADVQELDPQILAQLAAEPQSLRIQPNGSADSWNRQGQLQKAIARKQLLGQSPWINQPELDRSILELDDPRLVKRLFQDSQQKQRDEYRDEAEEVPALMLGFPMPVEPQEDHATRIKCLSDFMQQRAHTGAHPDPVARAAISQHLQAHLAALQQQNPKAAQAVQAGLKQLFAAWAAAPGPRPVSLGAAPSGPGAPMPAPPPPPFSKPAQG